MKNKSTTIRLTNDLHQKLINIAIKRSVKENRIVKISEIVRELIEKIND